MKLNLVNVDVKMARSVVSATAMEVGSLVEVKGLASGALVGRVSVETLTGEMFEVQAVTADDPDMLYAIIAPDVTDAQRYDEKERWNNSEYAQIKAKEPVRAYLLHRGDRYEIDAQLIDGVGVVAGDKLAVKAGDTKFAKVAGTEKAVVAKVLAKTKIDGEDAYDIIIL